MSFEEPHDEDDDDDFEEYVRRIYMPAERIAIVEAWLAEGYVTEAQARHLLEMREP
jgi:hypothetical protein